MAIDFQTVHEMLIAILATVGFAIIVAAAYVSVNAAILHSRAKAQNAAHPTAGVPERPAARPVHRTHSHRLALHH